MNNLFLSLLLTSLAVTIVGCGRDGSSGPHAYNDQRPEASKQPLTTPADTSLSAAQREAIEKEKARQLELQQKVFDFMATPKIRTLLSSRYEAPSYNSNDAMEYFVRLRCKGFVRKLSSAPASKTNLYPLLTEKVSDLENRICENTHDGTRLKLVPGQLIASTFAQLRVLLPEERRERFISLRPDNSVSGFLILDEAMNERDIKESFFRNNVRVEIESSAGTRLILRSANRFSRTTKLTALDESFKYTQYDSSEFEGTQTNKDLFVKLEGSSTLEAKEFVSVRKLILSDRRQVQASCHIVVKTGAETIETTIQSQCFPEHRL